MKKEKRYSILLEETFRIKFLKKAIQKFKNQTKLAKYINSRMKKRKVRRENIK